ncbi:MAG TPA: hypothetical protein VMH39_05190 [Gemmatimonadaceae bacterium]|nr:hypothetical protein [Gemmatimonadaceae bacterium]
MGAESASGAGVHATALVYGECGLLLFGPSGAGKSALALALLALGERSRVFAALIGDDRAYLRSWRGRLIVSGAPQTAGLIERRAIGLVTVAHEPSAVVRLTVELSGRDRNWPRMPDAESSMSLIGITVPLVRINSNVSAVDQSLAIADCLERMTLSSSGGKRIPLEQCPAVHKNRKVAASPPLNEERTVD